MTRHLLGVGVVLSLFVSLTCLAADDYKLGPDSEPREEVPHGLVTKYEWSTSKVFPGSTRAYHVYVPAQYDAAKPTPFMIFQDGTRFANTTLKSEFRIPIVLDNLIAKKDIPPMIAIFVDPGVVPATQPKDLPRFNRSLEYDGMGDAYARFLAEEIIPEVAKKYNLSKDPNDRGISGSSSGGAAAFNAAWERPDQFRRVISFIGSYTYLRGSYYTPGIIRKTEPRPVRAFLQDGTNDLDIYAGSWYDGALGMGSALKFAGYDHQLAIGDGAHTSRHGASLLPDAMRWAWKDWPKPVMPGGYIQGAGSPETSAAATQPRRPLLMDILIHGEDWQLVGEGYGFTEGPATDANGDVYFTDGRNNRIYKVDADGKPTVWMDNASRPGGMMFGPDGLLYATQSAKNRIVAIDKDKKETVIVEGITPNDLCVNRDGAIYFTEPNGADTRLSKVWFVPPASWSKDGKREKQLVASNIAFPNGVRFTPDQSQLVIADTRGANCYLADLNADGTLANSQPYFILEIVPGRNQSGADGMTYDSKGWLYVATAMGLQVCDQAGRVNGIIARPMGGVRGPSNVTFGGPDRNYLYITYGDKVYRRKTQAKGVRSCDAPVTPPAPRL